MHAHQLTELLLFAATLLPAVPVVAGAVWVLRVLRS